MLSDEQMSKGWLFSLLNDEQLSNKVGVEHRPVKHWFPLRRPKIRALFFSGGVALGGL